LPCEILAGSLTKVEDKTNKAIYVTHITTKSVEPIAQFFIRTMKSDMEAIKQGKTTTQVDQLPLVSITEAPTPIKPFSNLSVASLQRREPSKPPTESLLKKAPEIKKGPAALPAEIKKIEATTPPETLKQKTESEILQTIDQKLPKAPTPPETLSQKPPAEISIKAQEIKSKKIKQIKVVFIVILGIFLIAGISGATYYFIFMAQPKPELPEFQPPPEIKPPTPLLSINSTEIITIKDKTTLVNKLTSVLASDQPEGTLKYIPIKITEPEEKFISFKELAEILNFNIPQEIMGQYNDQYSLIIYSQKKGIISPFLKNISKNRLCLILALKNSDIEDTLIEWEKTILQDLKLLYLNFNVAPISEAVFSNSERIDITPHRFINLNTSYLSLDYALFQNKLIITTSKESANKILDIMFNAS